MQIHFGTELLVPEWTGSVVCIGTFDGVHRGHQAVIQTAVAEAKRRSLPCCLVTFDRHPQMVLHPETAPKPIDSIAANLAEFARLGVSVTLVLPFSEALAQVSAIDFLDSILMHHLRAVHLVVGHDFAFGRGREGDGAWLAQRIETTVVPPFADDGVRISSSAIRQSVLGGDMKSAWKALGRPFCIPGVVVGGQRLGRTLGYPTLNLARSFDQLFPAYGVYAGRVRGSFGSYLAAVSIGERPSVEAVGRTIEAYLLDYPGDEIYGFSVELDLFQKVRDEAKFDSLEALVDQISLDVEAIRRLAEAEGW